MIVFEVPERSLLKRVDPRVRVPASVALAIQVCLSDRPVVLGVALAMAAVLTVLAGVRGAMILRNFKRLNFLMLVLAVFLPLSAAGEAAFRIGPLAWSKAGLWTVAIITLRANIVMIALTALLATMEPAHLGFALGRLGVPQKFVQIMLFMVRYVEEIHKEYHRLRDALRLRGFRPGCNRRTFRTLGYVVGLLLLRSIDRSERIFEAMKCRGFQGRFYVLAPFALSSADAVFTVAACGCAILLFWMQYS